MSDEDYIKYLEIRLQEVTEHLGADIDKMRGEIITLESQLAVEGAAYRILQGKLEIAEANYKHVAEERDELWKEVERLRGELK
jgi:hypothetical protein